MPGSHAAYAGDQIHNGAPGCQPDGARISFTSPGVDHSAGSVGFCSYCGVWTSISCELPAAACTNTESAPDYACHFDFGNLDTAVDSLLDELMFQYDALSCGGWRGGWGWGWVGWDEGESGGTRVEGWAAAGGMVRLGMDLWLARRGGGMPRRDATVKHRRPVHHTQTLSLRVGGGMAGG